MPGITFSVDTHVFRELGELLVGRDSTALLELIKNCYDADATQVVVTAVDLADAARGRIVIRDNGCGMDRDRFRFGFLRIASRLKEDDRKSDHFGRRFTGSKGIGRLAAHKLSKFMEVSSIRGTPGNRARDSINATIDWERIEAQTTLEGLNSGITLEGDTLPKAAPVGTTITLSKLRRPWSDRERTRFIAECRSFQVPELLREPLPSKVFGQPLLFENPQLRDTASQDPGCEVELEGDFSEGHHYWEALLAQTNWALEIDCSTDSRRVQYVIAPTKATNKEYPKAKRRRFEHPHPNPKTGPFFQARVLVRDSGVADKVVREWSHQMSGIRVYLEGFRVLPYGERGDDWLNLDASSARRSATRDPLTQELVASEDDQAGDWQLMMLPNNSYTGAVFLTQENATNLRMLVNREGFVAEQDYEYLVEIVKRGLDLVTRTRAAATFDARAKKSEERRKAATGHSSDSASETKPEASSNHPVAERQAETEKAKASLIDGLRKVRQTLAASADPATQKVAKQLEVVQTAADSIIRTAESHSDSAAMSRVLSALGTQMASFVHEINGMLGSAVAVHQSLGRLREDRSLPSDVRAKLNPVYKDAGDLRRQIERQAAYMVEITSTDARRRRSKQVLSDRFDAATRLVAPAIDRRGISLTNEIPDVLKSPPMFPAELTVVYSNLLTNAVKAAGKGGAIRARGYQLAGKATVVIENTGDAVDLNDGERWFLPFESTTVEVDSTLGQGMGLGLTITRDILEQYGATIKFVSPSRGFATAVEIQFSDSKEKS